MGGGLLPPHPLPSVPHLIIRISMLIPIKIQIRDPDWHQNDVVPTSTLTFLSHLLENPIFYTFSHSSAGLQCFIFLVIVNCVLILRIFDSLLKFCGKK